jgi:two-component system nitrate/nitrite response regulator NarL
MSIASFSTIVVGPCPIFREGLSRIIDAAGLQIAAAARSISEIPETQLPRDRSVLLIIEVADDEESVMSEIEHFKERFPSNRIALLAERRQLSDHAIIDAFRAGAHAYFVKPSLNKFIKSLELVMLGGTILPTELMGLMLQSHRSSESSSASSNDFEAVYETEKSIPRLSVREIKILRGLIAGDSNKTIARSFGVAEATLKVHVKSILRKVGVRNRTQAAIWALSHPQMTSSLPSNGAPLAG